MSQSRDDPPDTSPDTPPDYDVIIIGAGINGAGLFRDLCLQGLTCLIVDKGDFGSGTSAAPSRLIHGGLKYLETGEFRLVAESTRERNLLLKNAPHVVKPLPTVIPVRSWFSGIRASVATFLGRKTAFTSRGMVLVGLGLWLYDRFSQPHRSMPKRQFFLKAGAARLLPSLTGDIVGLGGYYDAKVTEPERLVLELIEDGLAASPGSRALNYCPVTACADGRLSFAPETVPAFTARAACVVNAAGPWIDRVNAAIGLETALIGGTKGSHIILDDPGLVAELDGRMIYFEGDDGRILLVFDYHGKLLVGSTDIPADDPDDLVCTEAEIAYFLHGLKSLFPARAFPREAVVYSYAGLRPLPNSAGLPPGLISRDHSAPVHPPSRDRPFPVISLVGGKWTTFRAFAEEVADQLLDRLGKARRIGTELCAIGGGAGYPADGAGFDRAVAELARSTGAPPEMAARWLQRYGPEKAREICRASPDTQTRLGDYTAQELAWIAARERVVHLDDLLFRRTQIALLGQARAHLDAALSLAGDALDWSDSRRAEERARVLALLERH